MKGGTGYAYEYGGEAFDRMSMEERMTVCNMSIEGAARVGYVNPDETTFEYMQGRPFVPQGADFDKARAWWESLASDPDANYDDEVEIDAATIEPTVTWGINPGQSVGISERTALSVQMSPADERASVAEALEFMSFRGGMPIMGTKIDVAFIGSCTNGRISDLREAARLVKGQHVAKHVKALVVPGSQSVRKIAEQEGLDKIFTEAGFEWRGAGCSMCLAMNPDQLQGRQICASSSNRNFKGRQGSPTGRTLLMSPAMVAAAAVAGEVVDVRRMLRARRGTRVMDSRFVDRISGRAVPAARPRHRYRSDHPGAVSQERQLRGSRDARLRRRPQAAGRARPGACVLEPALRRREDSDRERQLRLRVVARACAAGAFSAGASAPSSASRSRRSSSATRSRSACRASP